MRQIGGLKSISLIKFNDAMTGPSIGRIFRKTGGNSDFIGWMSGLGRSWISSVDETAIGMSSKNSHFYFRFESVFKLILHKPSAVVDCSEFCLVFLLSVA